MEKIQISDLRNLQEYEEARPLWRQRVIALKQRRRLALGPLITLVFENRETALFQIQEMLRIERIVAPAKVKAEVDVYNALVPDAGELSATLLIEVTDPAAVKPVLDSFIGLDEGKSLWMDIAGRRYFAVFEAGHGREDKISAVHYVRFPLGREGGVALASSEDVAVEIRHGDYRARARLMRDTVDELRKDLATA